MADEHLFTADVEGPAGPTAGRNRWQSCLVGCLIVFVVAVVMAVLFGYWISRNWRGLAATGMTELIRQGMATSHLPPEEQQEIMVQVDRVAQAFQNDEITGEQAERLAELMFDSPFLSMIEVTTVEDHYFSKSGLSQKEQIAGRQIIQRFVRGAIDKQINQDGIDAAMSHIAFRHDPGPDDHWTIRDTLTDDQLRAFLAEATQRADAAGIPDQPTDIDPSEEVKKIVDQALAPA
jgi:hypothetical protein